MELRVSHMLTPLLALPSLHKLSVSTALKTDSGEQIKSPATSLMQIQSTPVVCSLVDAANSSTQQSQGREAVSSPESVADEHLEPSHQATDCPKRSTGDGNG